MEIEATEILKWVGLVFAAGFVGYFGRYLSMLILEKIHKKKNRQPRRCEAAGPIGFDCPIVSAWLCVPGPSGSGPPVW